MIDAPEAPEEPWVSRALYGIDKDGEHNSIVTAQPNVPSKAYKLDGLVVMVSLLGVRLSRWMGLIG